MRVRTDMDFSSVLRTERMLRPSCIPWDLRGHEKNAGESGIILSPSPLTSMGIGLLLILDTSAALE